jgi:hypothetical protein
MSGKWEKQKYYRAVWDLQRNYQQRIKIDGPVDLPLPEFHDMERVLKTYDVDYSDALHVVLLRSGFYAHLAGSSTPVLVAADKTLLDTAKAEGIVTWNPESEDELPS